MRASPARVQREVLVGQRVGRRHLADGAIHFRRLNPGNPGLAFHPRRTVLQTHLTVQPDLLTPAQIRGAGDLRGQTGGQGAGRQKHFASDRTPTGPTTHLTEP
jgi:hypothetical protein